MKFRKIAESMLKSHKEEVAKELKNMKAECRFMFIENIGREENVRILCDNFSDSSNGVKNFVFEYLKNRKQYVHIVLEKTHGKRIKDRETAIKLLCEYNLENSRQIFEELLAGEKNEKVKKLLRNILGIKEERTDGVILNKSEEEIYVEKGIERVHPNLLKYIDIETLPKIRIKDKEECCSDEYLRLLITGYYYAFDFNMVKVLRRMDERLNKDDLKLCAAEVLTRWIDGGEESKSGCAMIFAAAYGDEEVIDKLIDKISQWPKRGRYSICGYALRGFALNGSRKCIMEISRLSKKAKNNGVKNGALRALSMYCSLNGIKPDDLEDKLIPDLGFNEEFEVCYDYGNRKFTARLNSNLELDIYDEKGKRLKSLPAANKSDDIAKVKDAKSELKSLKKDLKDCISIQKMRLTEAMIGDKKWPVKEYRDVFIDNVIMNMFAYSQIFGVYEKSEDTYKLKETFRYMNDGTFNNKDDEEFNFESIDENNNLIGMVHPLELDDEETELWKKQLEDYEIIQPVNQINRNVYRVSEEKAEDDYVDEFENEVVNGLSLVHKLMSAGWKRGDIGDNGTYDYLEKVSYDKEFTARLEIECTAFGIENTDLAVGKLKFYKGRDFKNTIKLCKVDLKFYSETLSDVNKVVCKN